MKVSGTLNGSEFSRPVPSSPHSRLYSLGYRATSTLLEASKKAQKEAEMKELV